MISRRGARVALVIVAACALLAVASVVMEDKSSETELMWGGPLSFDMVHTHILNMKMRRSRLKEKLKQAALKRKDREIAQEHGFNAQGTSNSPGGAPQQQMAMQPPPAPQYAPPAPQYAPQFQQQPMQAPQMYQQPMQQMQQPMQQMQQEQPMQQMPQEQPNPYEMPNQQPPNMQQPPAFAYGEQPGYPPAPQAYNAAPPAPQFQYPNEAPQLAQMPAANPWGGMTVSSAASPAVAVAGPTESSSDDKDQQRAQAAASIQAYEQFMHGGAPAAKPAAPGGAQGMMMHA